MDIATIGVDESIDDIVDHMWPPAQIVDELSDLPCEVRLVKLSDEQLLDCDAIITVQHSDSVLASDVKWVHTISAGVDQFPVSDYRVGNILLTNSSGIHSESGGEHALALMVMLAGQHHQFVKNQVQKRWEKPKWDGPFTLHGESVCIIGTGTIGTSVAERSTCLGMTVTGVNRSGSSVEPFDEVLPSESLHQAIDGVRFVVLTVPLTEQTRGMIGKEEFHRMRDDAYLINISRGPVVDEPAMIEALDREEIRGAGLDVFYEEPLPESSQLWETDDVIITPHCAGYFKQHYVAVADIVRENYRRLSAGETPINDVT